MAELQPAVQVDVAGPTRTPAAQNVPIQVLPLSQVMLPRPRPVFLLRHVQPLVHLQHDGWAQRCLLHGAMNEVAGEDDLGVYLFFQVVINRMKSGDFGGHTACDVIHARLFNQEKGTWEVQFSGVKVSEVLWHPAPSAELSRVKRLLANFLSGSIEVPWEYRSALYYLNPCFSDPGPTHWFKTALHPLGRHDHHSFFTEGKPDIPAARRLIDVACPARPAVVERQQQKPAPLLALFFPALNATYARPH